MELISVKEAAEYVGASTRTINYWVCKGYVKRYPNGKRNGTREGYLVNKADIENAPDYKERFDLNLKIKSQPENFILPKEAVRILKVNRSTIDHYIKRGYLTKYYVLDSDKNYALDRNEVYGVPAKVETALRKKEIKEYLRVQTAKMKRDINGRFLPNNRGIDERADV